MGLNCGCPAGASLPDVSVLQCKESLGQVQKVIFQRIYEDGTDKNMIAAADAVLKATYTSLKTAADGTKIVVSPIINNPTTEPGAPRLFGGGNQTAGGIEVVIGSDPTTFEGVMYQESQIDTIKPLKEMMCEQIGVYLIDEYGNIGAIKQSVTSGSTTTVNYLPIPIQKFFIGDKKLGGFEEPDSNSIQWSFNPNWSDDLAIIKQTTMDFNPLTDI